MIALMGFAMIIIFMALIMKKKISPFIGLVALPVSFAALGQLLNFWSIDIGEAALSGLMTTAKTGIMLFFAIYMFTIMIDAGLFDPLSNLMIKYAKGDPLKVSLATVLLTILVSLNGDGTTTMIIVSTAMVPIYKKLNMNLLDLAVLTMTAHSIINLLPWGGPTARAIAVMEVGTSEVMRGLVPMMAVAIVYMFAVAYWIGKQEQKRLGVIYLTDQEIADMMVQGDGDNQNLKRPHLVWLNATIVLITVGLLVVSDIPPAIIFMVGTVVTLLVNYPNLKDQKGRIDANASEANQVVMTVFAAGVFMGILKETGMADGIATALLAMIPDSLGRFYGLIVAILSALGTYFLHNDAFYYGMMPILRQAGEVYGFTDLQLTFASLMGQAFHLFSPLVPFSYVLLGMTGVDWGAWQKKGLVVSLGIFIIYVIVGGLLGLMPIII
ncbi:citrate transporter [Aerococcus urinaehominis]|uniref:Citrate transporter n=1 Tax=Aerococcus urinaehominis TaxID=128944 RepID=A0A0X8FKB3_9LACT|nr:citrate:proton symporter [Aerococcus urinaehominis]AMB98659.1 citrate transporter [Aerococcus urinaehominis]SDL97475.1 citrate-Mg2+:H+ or citrate-Ca2+:H+ symporter, CitMHS family [Aerococcus urinaehominis]